MCILDRATGTLEWTTPFTESTPMLSFEFDLRDNRLLPQPPKPLFADLVKPMILQSSSRWLWSLSPDGTRGIIPRDDIFDCEDQMGGWQDMVFVDGSTNEVTELEPLLLDLLKREGIFPPEVEEINQTP